jgi:hypothetical protein
MRGARLVGWLGCAGGVALVVGAAAQGGGAAATPPRDAAYLAAGGMLLVVAALPYVLFAGGLEHARGRPVSPWRELLAEPGGGLSLSRVQLLVWFAPALAMYAAASVPLHRFAALPPALAVLLGMAGATTLLGTAANPRLADAPVEPAMPAATLSDLVEDWSGHADLSRYQYLLLTILGALLVGSRFFEDFTLPDVPREFLALVGASQATYLGTKAVKTGREPEAVAPPPPGAGAPQP